MPEAAEQPTEARRGRSLAGFYIAVGIVAALFGLGVALRKPLTLGYAIHRVQSDRPTEPSGIGLRVRDRWLDVCLEAARAGNARAMEALVACSRPAPRAWDVEVRDMDFIGLSRLFLAAEAQPEVFVAALDRLDDRRAREVVEHIAASCAAAEVGDQCDVCFDSPAAQAAELGRLSRSGEPGLSRLAQATLEFVRCRFPEELTKDAAAPEHRGRTEYRSLGQ
jgi:hypothetical protein